MFYSFLHLQAETIDCFPHNLDPLFSVLVLWLRRALSERDAERAGLPACSGPGESVQSPATEVLLGVAFLPCWATASIPVWFRVCVRWAVERAQISGSGHMAGGGGLPFLLGMRLVRLRVRRTVLRV